MVDFSYVKMMSLHGVLRMCMGQRILRVACRVDVWDLPVFSATTGLRDPTKRGLGTSSPSGRRWERGERSELTFGGRVPRTEHSRAWYGPPLNRSTTCSQKSLRSIYRRTLYEVSILNNRLLRVLQ